MEYELHRLSLQQRSAHICVQQYTNGSPAILILLSYRKTCVTKPRLSERHCGRVKVTSSALSSQQVAEKILIFFTKCGLEM